MRSARGDVAGVPTIFLRIGFVGETGWELHFPSEYGEHMWDALMEAGHEFGIAPFGVEAQRVLRLEKGHVIVNQDTDAVSNPMESDLGWAVRFDKEDFIGRAGLVAAEERGLKNKLVGFVMDDDVVPEDGVPVMTGSTPIGRVTSSRLSPTLGRGFGLAWVPVDMAEDGTIVQVRVNGRPAPATIKTEPVYDSEGKRLRE
jgi:sarcosine oxidase subunit alpha